MLFETVTAPITAWRSVMHEERINLVLPVNLIGSVFRLEVRDHRNGGMLRAALDTVSTAAAEGVRIEGVDDLGDGIVRNRIIARFNETTMEAMPLNPVDPEADHTLVWGMHMTPSGGSKFMAFDGPFIVKAGVPA